MSNTITSGSYTLEPFAVTGYDSARLSGNIVHQILGKSEPDITLRPAALRTGTLNLAFDDETDSAEAVTAHATSTDPFTLTTALGTVDMTYVVAGDIRRTLDETRKVWTVAVSYQEINP